MNCFKYITDFYFISCVGNTVLNGLLPVVFEVLLLSVGSATDSTLLMEKCLNYESEIFSILNEKPDLS